MDKYAIIVAGGSGSRMGTVVPKQFLLLLNKPVLLYAVDTFLTAFNDLRVVVALPETNLGEGTAIMKDAVSPDRVEIVAGGVTRFLSVQNGLARVPKNCIVFVHDGVRCLLTGALIQRCYETAISKGNAIPAITAVDSIRMETTFGSEQVDRMKVRIIQTPQTFISDTLIRAYRQDYKDSFTDDASVVESMGEKINLVEGEVTNIKITRKIDLLIAEQILKERQNS